MFTLQCVYKATLKKCFPHSFVRIAISPYLVLFSSRLNPLLLASPSFYPGLKHSPSFCIMICTIQIGFSSRLATVICHRLPLYFTWSVAPCVGVAGDIKYDTHWFCGASRFWMLHGHRKVINTYQNRCHLSDGDKGCHTNVEYSGNH